MLGLVGIKRVMLQLPRPHKQIQLRPVHQLILQAIHQAQIHQVRAHLHLRSALLHWVFQALQVHQAVVHLPKIRLVNLTIMLGQQSKMSGRMIYAP